MASRRHPLAGLSEEMVLARLAGADNELTARALRRHAAWRQAIDAGSSPGSKRTLRRAWERARDEALIAISVMGVPTEDDRPEPSPVRSLARQAGARA